MARVPVTYDEKQYCRIWYKTNCCFFVEMTSLHIYIVHEGTIIIM
jgi:hypothetical protein